MKFLLRQREGGKLGSYSVELIMIVPIILAGGSGSRLWPMSRKLYPKQFLSLHQDGQTLLQETVLRVQGISKYHPYIVCGDDHRFLVAEQLREMTSAKIMLEPVAKNTAPSITLAAIDAVKNFDDPILGVFAADHVIENQEVFRSCVEKASRIANLGKMVTFGIVPTHPETGYGHIQKGARITEDGDEVEAFIEKPDEVRARLLFDSGNYLWNSGMFVFKASVYLDEIKKHNPDILEACKCAYDRGQKDLDFFRVDRKEFEKCPNDSIDYAVLEKTKLAAVVSMDAGWSDIGSWQGLWEKSQKDEQDNVTKGDVITHETKNSLLFAKDRLVVGLGLEKTLVVETKDAVLVASMERAQDVKKIVQKLEEDKREEHSSHQEVFRPWGSYDSIGKGDRYQVKKIRVKAGAQLSLQKHHHRAEHWIVVKGTARVTLGEKTFLVSENESTYIPVGEIHSLENPGQIPLELIEVQSGSYLGEDDIVRIKDLYGRVNE